MAFFGLSRLLDKKQFIAEIDQAPKLDEQEPSGKLRGWLVDKNQDSYLAIKVGGEIVYRFDCRLPRFDVVGNLHLSRRNLICGFELDFPTEILARIGSGCVALWAVSSSTESCIWQWEQNIATDKVAQEELRAYFFGLQHDVELGAFGRLGGKFPVHIFLHSCGNYGALRQTLRNLSNLARETDARGKAKFESVWIISDEGSSPDELRGILELGDFSNKVPVLVEERDSFKGWKTLCQTPGFSLEDFILHLEEDVDFEFMEVAQFLEDYADIPKATILMPTVYGGKVNLHGPELLSLSALRSCSSVNGANLPALYPTTKLGPMWLTRLGILERFEGEELLVQGAAAQTSSCYFPPEGRFTYYLDLRQPILISEQSPYHYDHGFGQRIQAAVDFELKWGSVAQQGADEVAVVLADDWKWETADFGWQYQVIALAKELSSKGAKVVFVSDGNEVFRYIDQFPVLSLSRYLENKTTKALSLILCSSALAMRASQALAYIFRSKVVFLAQRENGLQSLTHALDRQELAQWAFRGTFLPLTVQEPNTVLDLRESDFLPEAVQVGLRLNENSFFTQPRTRTLRSVVFIVNDAVNLTATGVDELKQASTNLRKNFPQSKQAIVQLYSSRGICAEVLSSFDESYVIPSAETLAHVYSSYEFVVDCCALAELSIIEAAQCGSIPCVLNSNVASSAKIFSEQIQLSNIVEVADKIGELASDPVLVETKRAALMQELAALKTKRFELIISNCLDRIKRAESRLTQERSHRKNLSLVVPVYNALDATVSCLKSVLRFAPQGTEIIIVNDASDASTTCWLREFASREGRVKLIDLEQNKGFVQACIQGVLAANPQNDVALVNSDIVITRQTLKLLQDAAYARFNVGLASVMATHSPHLQLTLNPEDNLFSAADALEKLVSPQHPTIITPEGMLLFIRRWAMDKFGFLDPVFNRGYCEESDMSMRMFLNGVDMVAADNALIHHRASASFGRDQRGTMISQNRPIFDARWDRFYRPVYREFLDRDPIRRVREIYSQQKAQVNEPIGYLEPESLSDEYGLSQRRPKAKSRADKVLDNVQVAFILPQVALGGGTLSVLQHVDELVMRGIHAQVFTISQTDVRDRPFLSPAVPISIEQLLGLNWTNQIVVATFWTTAYLVRALQKRYPGIRPYYYIQDYEPWFYSHPVDFPQVKKAEKTYDFGFASVAKTQFLADVVKQHHGVDVHVITPGINELIFYPGEQEKHYGRPRLAALYRPETPRRGTAELIEMLRILKRRLPELEVNLFGKAHSVPEDLANFVNLKGRLVPTDVAKLYRSSDIVVDLSFWQGFGRMGLEGMSCGVVPVLSRSGGVLRYAEDGVNSFLVDLERPQDAAERVIELAKNRELRMKMRQAGLKSSSILSESQATDDWVKLWGLKYSEPEEESFQKMPDIRALRAK